METRYTNYIMNPAAFLMAKRRELDEESKMIMMKEYEDKGLKEGLEQGMTKGTINGQINTLTRLLKKIYHQDLKQWLEGLNTKQLNLVEELILEKLEFDELIRKVEGEID